MAENNVSSAIPEKDAKSRENSVKIICLGDSAVGKSKLVERFLMDGYQPQQLSTFALTLFTYNTKINGKEVTVALLTFHLVLPHMYTRLPIALSSMETMQAFKDFWDTAGQERFSKMHPSYYHQAHSCILVFDVTRKVTYKNLPTWYKELREYRPSIPCLCAANKIDVDYKVTQKAFNFPKKFNLPFYFVSASDGTNVVKMFREAIRQAVDYKNNSTDFMDEVMRELEYFEDMKISPDSGLETAPHSEDKDEKENDEENESNAGTSS